MLLGIRAVGGESRLPAECRRGFFEGVGGAQRRPSGAVFSSELRRMSGN